MKKILYASLIILIGLGSTSYTTEDPVAIELINTKWISPIDDNCYDSLCFTSESNVMYYRCDNGTYFEIGYKINGDNIEIEAYSNSKMESATKMVLYMDDDILRMREKNQNYFAKNFIKVPAGNCN